MERTRELELESIIKISLSRVKLLVIIESYDQKLDYSSHTLTVEVSTFLNSGFSLFKTKSGRINVIWGFTGCLEEASLQVWGK